MNTTIYREDKIEALDGSEVVLPKNIPWKKEIAMSAVIGDLVIDFPVIQEKLKVHFSGKECAKNETSTDEIIDLLPELILKVPHHITKLVSILIDKEIKWVENNLNLDSIVEVVAPFLSYILRTLTRHTKGANPQITGAQQNTKARKKNH